VTFTYVFAFWCGIANIPSALTANVFDNNIQYLLHFSALVVITNCAWFIFRTVFYALNCTSGVFGIKLLLIHYSWRHKLIYYWLCLSRGVTLIPHLLLVPWTWKSRAIPLLSLWAVRPVQSLSACTVELYLYSPCGPYGLYRASMPVQ
jgi:hypothetical protein